MRKFIKITLSLLLLIAINGCNQEKIDNPLNLEGMDLNLNIKLNEGTFNLDNGIDNLAKEIANYIFDENINSVEKLNTFNIQKSGNKLLINKKIDKNIARRMEFGAPCKSKSKTCRSKSCVKKALVDILGDGSRDVIIKYTRHTLSVTIEYTYQDC